MWPLIHIGRAQEFAESFKRYEDSDAATVDRITEAIALAHTGQLDKARESLKLIGELQEASQLREKLLLLHLAALLEDNALCSRLASELQPLGTGLGFFDPISIGRVLGEAAIVTGDIVGARHSLSDALDVCQSARFRPELALVRLDLAELLLEHYPDEREAAIEHLDFAIAEFREMKMQPSLERALRHRGLLKA